MVILQVGLVVLVVGIRAMRQYWGLGWGGVDWLGNGLLVLGWMIGYVLAEVDHLLYALMCNPQELSCMRIKNEIANRRYKSAWRMLKETAGERMRLPIHNLVTGLVIAVMGVWLVTSAGSLLASGVVVGLSLRLLIEFWRSTNYHSWYWLFARQFEPGEHRVLKLVWSGLVVIQCLLLWR